MRYAFILLFFLVVSYLLVRNVYTHHPHVLEPVNALIQHGLIEPVMDAVPAIRRLSDWLPTSSKKYIPNPYGYGGMDPAGGERKGGDGRGIPDVVPVGWWNGEIDYSDKQLSPIQDTEELPSVKVVQVGWWGDDWF